MPEERDSGDRETRCGIIAVVGRTNVGKSTLVNRLVGEKVSIVTPIVQTTRNQVRAVLTEQRGQLVFMDTPGVHKSRNELGKLMNKMARSSAGGADLILLVLDSSAKPHQEDDGWMRRMLFAEQAFIFVLNKSDKGEGHAARYQKLWKEIQAERCEEREAVWLSTSATGGAGTDDLLAALFERVTVGPLLFPEELLTDYPRKLAIADTIREKLYEYLKDELPHAVAVRVDTLDEQDNLWDIEASIYVERSSQKGIVLGRKGRALKKAREQSVSELTEMFDREIRLRLWVKVEKNWTKNFFFLKTLGHVS